MREEMRHIREGKHGARSPEEGTRAASHAALSRHAKTAARQRTAKERSASAKKAARTRAHNAK